MKLSPWHDGSVKPVHVGVYQTDEFNSCFGEVKFYSYWGGETFHGEWSTKQRALKNKNFISLLPVAKWRGILK